MKARKAKRNNMAFWTSGSVSKSYDLYRISYPAELFDFVVRCAPGREAAIDVGCGTGQAIRGISSSFARVVGVDPSASQIDAAFRAPNVEYVQGAAESFLCPPDLVGTVDLITVAQAMHWFNIPLFARHCEKILKPGGIIAAWTYPLCRVTPSAIEKLLDEMNNEMHQSESWPKERRFVDNNYATLLPLFAATSAIQFAETSVFPVVQRYTVMDFLQYLSTMSGVGQYRKKFPDRKDLLERYGQQMVAAAGGSMEAVVEATFTNHVFIMKKCGPSNAKL